MKNWFFYSLSVLLSAAALFGGPAQAAETVPLTQLPNPLLVQERREDLLERGCSEVVPQGAEQAVTIPDNAPRHIAPANWVVGQPVFCPELVALGLTPKAGQVKPAVAGAEDPNINICSRYALQQAAPQVNVGEIVAAGGALSGIFDFIAGVLGAVWLIVMWLYAELLNILLQICAFLANRGLLWGQFTTHPTVKSVAGLLLGFINILFILGILYIAIKTLLGRGDFDFKKPLVRLLLAAMLINFSLVLCGVAIDASRVIMAAELRTLASNPNDHINDIGIALPCTSGLFRSVFELRGSGWLVWYKFSIWIPNATELINTLFRVQLTIVMLTAMTVGIVFLGVGSLIRIIWLLLLSATAPVAFIGYIFDNFYESVTKKWLYNFGKYVIYGPLALLVLIVLAKSVSTDAFSRFSFENLDGIAAIIFANLLSVAVLAGLFIGGAIMATKMSGFGASAIGNWAVKNKGALAGSTLIPAAASAWLTRKAGQGIGAGGRAIQNAGAGGGRFTRLATGLGGGALRGLGAATRGTGVALDPSAYKKAAKIPGDFLDALKKSQEKKEKERAKSSYGSALGERVFEGGKYKERKKIENLAAQKGKLEKELDGLPAMAMPVVPTFTTDEMSKLSDLSARMPVSYMGDPAAYMRTLRSQLVDGRMPATSDAERQRLKDNISGNSSLSTADKNNLKNIIDSQPTIAAVPTTPEEQRRTEIEAQLAPINKDLNTFLQPAALSQDHVVNGLVEGMTVAGVIRLVQSGKMDMPQINSLASSDAFNKQLMKGKPGTAGSTDAFIGAMRTTLGEQFKDDAKERARAEVRLINAVNSKQYQIKNAK